MLDLSAYRFADFALSRTGSRLDMQGPGKRGIGINSFFTNNTIDTFKFSDVTLTAKQIKQKVV